MINSWSGVGRLTRDVELRYTQSGVAVAMLTLAINRPFKNAQGENEADFINIVAWRQLAELVANYLKKGDQAGVSGRLQTRSYDDKDGKRVFVTEVNAENVQFLSTKNSQQSNDYGEPPKDPFANSSKSVDISDDDLPF